MGFTATAVELLTALVVLSVRVNVVFLGKCASFPFYPGWPLGIQGNEEDMVNDGKQEVRQIQRVQRVWRLFHLPLYSGSPNANSPVETVRAQCTQELSAGSCLRRDVRQLPRAA